MKEPLWQDRLPAPRRLLRMVCDDQEDYPWRIVIRPSTGSVEMYYIGHLPIEGPRIKGYKTLDTAPEWVKDRVAVLSMLEPNVHTSAVFGVGRRVSEYVYWAVLPRELHGIDT